MVKPPSSKPSAGPWDSHRKSRSDHESAETGTKRRRSNDLVMRSAPRRVSIIRKEDSKNETPKRKLSNVTASTNTAESSSRKRSVQAEISTPSKKKLKLEPKGSKTPKAETKDVYDFNAYDDEELPSGSNSRKSRINTVPVVSKKKPSEPDVPAQRDRRSIGTQGKEAFSKQKKKNSRGRDVTPDVTLLVEEPSESRQGAAKVSPMKTRGVQRIIERANMKDRCGLCKLDNDEALFPCAECGFNYHLRKCMRYSEVQMESIHKGKRRRWLCPQCLFCEAPNCGGPILDAINDECRSCALPVHGRCIPSTGRMINGYFFCFKCADSTQIKMSPAKEREYKLANGIPEEAKKKGRKISFEIPIVKKRKVSKADNTFEAIDRREAKARQYIYERDLKYDLLNEEYRKKALEKRTREDISPPRTALRGTHEDLLKISHPDDVSLFEQAVAAVRKEHPEVLADSIEKKRLEALARPIIPRKSPLRGEEEEEDGHRPWIFVGARRQKMLALYRSPYPSIIWDNDEMFICPWCLRALPFSSTYTIHVTECTWRCPPGNEIYRQDGISLFEVDGKNQVSYCRRLCLLGKCFIGSKTLVNEVDMFKFYCLVEHTDEGTEFVGYFSKEKMPSESNNLSCLLTLPNAMRAGYGQLLIELSYQLSRVENKVGGPEHPLSDLGLLAYRKYWKASIVAFLRARKNAQSFSLKEMALVTRIGTNEILQQLMADKLVAHKDGAYFINMRKTMRLPLSTIRRRVLREGKLVWKPEQDVPEGKEDKLNPYHKVINTESANGK